MAYLAAEGLNEQDKFQAVLRPRTLTRLALIVII